MKLFKPWQQIVVKTECWIVILGLAVLVTPGFAWELRALIVDGRNDHPWQRTTPILKGIFEDTGLFVVDVSTSPLRTDPYGGWNPNFSKYDVVVSNFSDSEVWPEPLRKSFVDYVRSGGGFVAVHAATNAFGDWPEYCEMVGLGWRGAGNGDRLYFNDSGDLIRVSRGQGVGAGHGPRHQFAVDIRNKTHPITRGLPSKWMHAKDDLYHGQRGPARNMTILATAYSAADKRGTSVHEPMIWTVPYGNGRVFATVMGDSPESMSCVGFATTIQRGAEWTATGEVTQEVPKDFLALRHASTRTVAATDGTVDVGLGGNVEPNDPKEKSSQTVRIAGIILKWVRGNHELNFLRIEPMIREAAANGAEIIVTTECFLDGYAVTDKSMARVIKNVALGLT